MSYQRPLNKQATAEARKRHANGEQVLQYFFRLDYDAIRARKLGLGMQHSLDGLVLDCAPFRSQPGCPRPRTASEKARHLKRKRARAARRCNR